MCYNISQYIESPQHILPTQHPVLSVSLSTTGNMLAAGLTNGDVILWNLWTDEPQSQTLLGAGNRWTSWTASVAFNPDGRILVAGSTSGIRMWDLRGDGQVKELDAGNSVSSVSFSPDGRLASGDDTGFVSIWGNPWLTDRPEWTRDTLSQINTVCFNPEGTLLAVGSNRIDTQTHESTGEVTIWNPQTGILLKTFSMESSWVHSLSFSPDGTKIATGLSDAVIAIWNILTDRNQPHQVLPVESLALSLDYHPIGRTLAAGLEGGNVVILDPEIRGNQPLQSLPIGSPVSSINYSHDGLTLAVGSEEGVSIWLKRPRPTKPPRNTLYD